MDLLTVLERDTRLKRVSRTDGGEYAGACPFCGGEDRFRVWPEAEHPRYWCRGCNRRGDAIAYLREHDGLSFRQACAELGLEPGLSLSPTPAAAGACGNRVPAVSPAARAPTPAPRRQDDLKPTRPPPPNRRWQEAATAFCREAVAALWSERGEWARAYLLGRGLTEPTIRRALLGWHPAAREEPAARWGLADGKPAHLPAGIVIPGTLDGDLWGVKVRRPNGEPRYLSVRGSQPLLYRAETLAADRPAALLEGELDALLVAQEAGDLVAAVASGSTGGARQLCWQLALATPPLLLVAYDADAAGDEAARWWLVALRTARRWSPLLKDPGEMMQAGLALRGWIADGLAVETPPQPAEMSAVETPPQPAEMPAVLAPSASAIDGVSLLSQATRAASAGRRWAPPLSLPLVARTSRSTAPGGCATKPAYAGSDEKVSQLKRQPSLIAATGLAASKSDSPPPLAGEALAAAPTQAGQGCASRVGGAVSSETPTVHAGGEPACLADLSSECWRCGREVESYDLAGRAWCEGCLADGRAGGWQDLLNRLPLAWRDRELAIWAAAAYHQAGRPLLRFSLYSGASPERHAGVDAFQRIGWALDPAVGPHPRALRVLETLAADGGASLRRQG